MGKLSITLGEELEQFIAKRVESGEYDDADEYLRALVEDDRKKQEAKQKLHEMIDDARASGVSEKGFDEIWDAGVERARAKAKRREG
jgi:antitoxin ParD1/3/4